ncbi:Glutamate--cysteine ligase [Thalassocella blandensis]|nr:Glutamate--cysteine ligase [Thalassocella blandensis]
MLEIQHIPKHLFSKKNAPLLTGILRGLEREALRVSKDGELSTKPHPKGLGSALTHPQITTDFSEALLEIITPPTHSVDDLFRHLKAIHQYALHQLDDELLWTHSMPCKLEGDDHIPVAQYGSSNNGQMKTIYRVGLGHRYGRSMQTVAGVHYNFSLPNAFWAFLSSEQNSIDDLQLFKDKGYFSLIRNFRRHFWLLIYLFGASPALCESFVQGKPHNLSLLDDRHTFYSPYATSLRMGDLGYQSSAQESLYVCYNEKNTYIRTLCRAITQPHEAYQRIGVKDERGEYQQLNTSLLQIENEFYSAIRPKRTTRPGETALFALQNRGIEYIEVRCLDVDPYCMFGINPERAYFLDTFLLYCALQESPMSSPEETAIILRNQKKVVNFGRQPNLSLDWFDGTPKSLTTWAKELLEAMRPIAKGLDNANASEEHQKALELQMAKIIDVEKTPSAQILQTLQQSGKSFNQLALEMSRNSNSGLREQEIEESVMQRMNHMSEESLAEQGALEEASTLSFDEFIKTYYQQYATCKSCG